MFKIPQSNKEFKQDNSSDRKGNVAQTRNISFDKKGYISLAPRTQVLTDDSILTNLNSSSNFLGISAFAFAQPFATIYAVGTKIVYETVGTDVTNWNTASVTLNSSGLNDFAVFGDTSANQRLFACANTTTYVFDGTTWDGTGIDAQNLCYFVNLNKLAFADGNEVTLYTPALVQDVKLVLPGHFDINKMAWANNRLYIATRNSKNESAILFEWDGLTSEANNGYRVDGHTIFSVTPYKDGVVCITSKGELLYNNGGFKVLDRLPIFYKSGYVWQSGASNPLYAKVTHNGLISDGDYIYVGVDSRVQSTGRINDKQYFDDFPTGVWCYDPDVGLYHKYSIDSSRQLETNTIATSSIDTSTDVITVAGVTVPETGTPVFYFNQDENGLIDISSNSATPLKHGERYYTIKLSDTTLKLATTYSNAINSTAINLTGTGNNAQYLVFSLSDNFGQPYQGIVTALLSVDANIYANYNNNSKSTRLLIGGYVYDKADVRRTVIATVVDKHENRGHYVTPWMESSEIKDNFQTIINKFKPLLEEEDKIVIKYRTTECTLPDYRTVNLDSTTAFTEQWVDGNTYITTHDLSTLKTRSDNGIKDEVSIILKQGSGYTAHITSITENSGTYTVNIDETIPNVTSGDKLVVTYSNWTKLGEATKDTTTNLEGYSLFRINKAAKKIQFKIELRGFDIQIEEMIVNNKTHSPVL
jgi:hypothetical protein